MPYAGYLLNPGDMFQVDVDRVLYATGAPKMPEQIRKGRKLRKAQLRERKETSKNLPVAEAPSTPTSTTQGTVKSKVDIVEIRKQRRLDLKEIINQTEAVMSDKRRRVGAKRKIVFRALVKDVRSAMATLNRKSEKELDEELASLVSRLAIAQKITADADADEQESESKITLEEQTKLREALTLARENPIDESKPYATPWRPRPYMSCFAFIPRYLEVNHNICSAVYLRHPVARRGLAEVPTPFGEETQQLAFSWYLRRR